MLLDFFYFTNNEVYLWYVRLLTNLLLNIT